MDFLAFREKFGVFYQKYRYLAIILLFGIILMAIPSNEEKADPAEPSVVQQESMEDKLSRILGKIQGAGKVEVLLTEDAGAETLYQTDTEKRESSFRETTVVISDSSRQEEGLIRQVIPPTYLGAVVICQGGDKPVVKLAILEAVMKATGLRSNQISVLKMK